MADSMQHITFEPEEFARELKVVRRELADGEVDRQRVLWKMLQQTVYTTHPARHPIIGYLEVLNGTTNQTIIDFYHERYVPNNQVFVVVGDVDTQQVLDEVAKQYAGTPRGRETYVAFEDEPRAAFAARGDRGDGRGHLRSGAGLADRKAFASRSCTRSIVAAYILGEGESSRLVQRLKYEKQVVLGVNAMSDTPHYVAGYFAVMAVSSSGNVATGLRRDAPARSTGFATSWLAPRTWPRRRSRRRPSWSSAGKRSSKRPTAWGTAT